MAKLLIWVAISIDEMLFNKSHIIAFISSNDTAYDYIRHNRNDASIAVCKYGQLAVIYVTRENGALFSRKVKKSARVRQLDSALTLSWSCY